MQAERAEVAYSLMVESKTSSPAVKRPAPIEPDSAACTTCGGQETRHRVVYSYDYEWDDETGMGADRNQIIQCLGCDTVRYRDLAWTTDKIDDATGRPLVVVKVYPGRRRSPARAAGLDAGALPERIKRIYLETLTALNATAPTLTAGGLRAIVEAICLDQGVGSGNLQAKIDALEKRNLLTGPQAELLHEERYLGNAALHELVEPTPQDLSDGMDIVETLLSTIYVLPVKARRLRDAREKGAKGG